MIIKKYEHKRLTENAERDAKTVAELRDLNTRILRAVRDVFTPDAYKDVTEEVEVPSASGGYHNGQWIGQTYKRKITLFGTEDLKADLLTASRALSGADALARLTKSKR